MQNPFIGLDNLKTFLDNLKIEIQKAEDKAKAFATEKNTEQDSDVANKIAGLKTEIIAKISNALSESNQYTDQRITNNNNGYVKTSLTNLKNEVKQYTDDSISNNNTTINQKIDEAKSTSKKYTDDQIASTKTEITNAYTTEIKNLETNVKNYTDTKVSDITNVAQTYADNKVADAKTELKTYTDGKISDAKTEVKTYTDTKIQDTKNTIETNVLTTIKEQIKQSVDDGAVKSMRDEIKIEYRKYVDDSQDTQNTAIDAKLQALKTTLESYSDHNISELVGGSPELLNTLYELSNAIGNDPNFSTTITNLIGQKLNASEVTTVAEPNKIIRLDASGHIPASVLNTSGSGTGLTPAEKLKLDGIEEGANKYIHPATHPASMIVEETNKHFITDTERNKLAAIEENANHYVHPATHPATMIVEDSTHRFTSDAEKTKLAGIENGANRYIHPASHPATMIVEDSTHRWFSDAEKTKLAGIEPGATKYVHPATHPASMIVEESNRHFITDEERTKLASIEENANHYVHPVSHPASMIIEDETHKFMTAAEKNKLAGIEENANFYVHPTNHPPTMITEDASHRWFTDEERTKLAGIEAGATSGGGGLTEIDLGDNNVKGVLPITKGGTGSASIDQFIQKLYASGDKQNANFENIYCIVFEDGGKNSGRIKLADLRKKFLPTDEEFKQYLLRLPTI